MLHLFHHRFRGKHGRRFSGDEGFTLLELLVVLAILGLLAAIAGPPVVRYLGRAKTDTAKIQIQNLAATLDLFKMDVGRYPSPDEGLQALVLPTASAPNWNGPYLRQKTSLIDPWGTPYGYKVPGDHGDYDLFTLGADKTTGGTGENADVTNWQ